MDLDRSTWRTPEQVEADRRYKAAVLATYLDINMGGVPDIANALRVPLASLSRAFEQGFALKDVIYAWFYEKPRRKVPKSLMIRAQLATGEDFRA